MTLLEVLRAGKANIEKCGWCQGDELAILAERPADGNYPRCAATALSNFDDPDQGAINDAAEFFRKLICPNGGIGTWNDAPERTKEEVLAAYDKAIALAISEQENRL